MPDDETKNEKVENHKLVKQDNKPTPREIFKPTKGDAAHSGIKVALSSIPFVGGAISELFSLGMQSPLEKRKDDFIISLDERISELEDIGVLSSKYIIVDDEFIDVAAHALPIVIRNSSPEKLNALRNAVINTALKIDINRDSKFMYLNFINELNEIQIKIIKILNEPRSYIEKLFEINKNNIPQGYTYVDVLKDLRKILDVDKVLYDVSIKRLETDGLIDLSRETGKPIGNYDEHSIWLGKDELERRTKNLVTEFGQIFVKFISEEKIEKKKKNYVS